MHWADLKNIITDAFLKVAATDKKLQKRVLIELLLCFLLSIGQTVFQIKSFNRLKEFAKSRHSENFNEILVSYALSATVYIVFRYLGYVLFSFFIEKATKIYLREFLREDMCQGYTRFVKHDSSIIISNIQGWVLVYRAVAEILIFQLVALVTFTIYASFEIYRMASGFVLLLFFLYPAAFMIIYFFSLKKSLMAHREYVDERTRTSAKIFDKISNFDIIKAYGLENSESTSFYNQLTPQRRLFFKMKLAFETTDLVKKLILEAPNIAIVLILRTATDMTGRYSDIIPFVIIIRALNSFLKDFVLVAFKLSVSMGELVAERHAITETRNVVPEHSTGTIAFKDVALFYEDSAIISGVDISIVPGEKIAIVGHNGTGKSTLLKSLMGFTKYTGEILVNGVDVKQQSPRHLFESISYVSQNDYASDDTVLSNLRLGNKACSVEDVERISKLFGAHETFMALEDGYNTCIGVGGSRLSGGERQKLSLVRSAIKDSPIFLFDEATSSTDKQYEEKAIRTLLKHFLDKTVLMIIHDSRYLKYFDRVLFINNGKLEGAGKYSQLLKTSKNFKQFVMGKASV